MAKVRDVKSQMLRDVLHDVAAEPLLLPLEVKNSLDAPPTRRVMIEWTLEQEGSGLVGKEHSLTKGFSAQDPNAIDN